MLFLCKIVILTMYSFESIHLCPIISNYFQIKFNLYFFLLSKSAQIGICINERGFSPVIVYELLKSLKPM